MAEERFCPHCGRANPKAMPRCMNCGQRIIKGSANAGGLMLLEEEVTDVASRAPWWQTDPGSAIPPPPQVREELARAEAKQRDVERRAAEELRFQERVRAHESSRIRHMPQTAALKTGTNVAPEVSAAKTKNLVANCQRCGTPVGEAGAVFSFCLNCGSDVGATPGKSRRRGRIRRRKRESAGKFLGGKAGTNLRFSNRRTATDEPAEPESKPDNHAAHDQPRRRRFVLVFHSGCRADDERAGRKRDSITAGEHCLYGYAARRPCSGTDSPCLEPDSRN